MLISNASKILKPFKLFLSVLKFELTSVKVFVSSALINLLSCGRILLLHWRGLRFSDRLGRRPLPLIKKQSFSLWYKSSSVAAAEINSENI